MKKRVAYLIGTGAIQASLDYEKNINKILMKNIKDMMFAEIDKKNIKDLKDVKNQLGEKSDVEHLISLYSQAGHRAIAHSLENLFYEALIQVVRKIDKSSDGFYISKLLLTLFDLYNLKDFDEELTGVLTINYEDFIERSFQEIFGGINYGFKFRKHKTRFRNKGSVPKIIKIHGSFNWENVHPINVNDDLINNNNSEKVLWISPGIIKDRSRYPFNKLWGISHEILDCDILRVIGCSLNRNDWHLVLLLYITQQLSKKKQYVIELINSQEECEKIEDSYNYLVFKKVSENVEISKHLKKEYPNLHEKDIQNYIKGNIFEMWLRSIIESKFKINAVTKQPDIEPEESFVYQFYNNTWRNHENTVQKLDD